MTFNIYYINLPENTSRNKKMHTRLDKLPITSTRFNGIRMDLKQLQGRHAKKISRFGKLYCPLGALGCGLSHLMLIERIRQTDPFPYALILEDDAEPIDPHFYDTIVNELAQYPDDWDIIKLHHDGFAYVNSIHFGSFINGSTAAYLISKKGMETIRKHPLSVHLDWQYWWLHQRKKIRMYKWKTPLFVTCTDESDIRKRSPLLERLCTVKVAAFKPLYFYLLTPFIRLPYTRIELNIWNTLVFSAIMATIFIF